MRDIVVDGERWKWAVRKEPDYSEVTPCDERTITLQGPDGYRRSMHLDFHANGNDAVTPQRVADLIRSLRSQWPAVDER